MAELIYMKEYESALNFITHKEGIRAQAIIPLKIF